MDKKEIIEKFAGLIKNLIEEDRVKTLSIEINGSCNELAEVGQKLGLCEFSVISSSIISHKDIF